VAAFSASRLRPQLNNRTPRNLLRRLVDAGFPRDFLRSAILPDWWDPSCERDPALLPELEIRIARFLGVPASHVRDADMALTPPTYSGAQLRRVRDVDRDRLAPAIHAAIATAEAAVRNIRQDAREVRLPPANGLDWRREIERTLNAVSLDDLLRDLWARGIAVLSLRSVPSPSFQGLACIVKDRPAIILGHQHDEPGRVAFIVAHEAGHIAAGHAQPNEPVVDEDEEIMDNTSIERDADGYATQVLTGHQTVPEIDGIDFRRLAKRAIQLEQEQGVDASALIFAWARRSDDYATAARAVKALYRGHGAARLLHEHFRRNVEVEKAPESDQTLLRCVHGGYEADEAAD
jgi:Zn-dependent peptidase ImmA (M78 family)